MDTVLHLFIPLGLALIMFTMGLRLSLSDFTRIAVQPKAFVVGLFAQLLILPIIAAALIKLTGVQGDLAVGLMIIAACPGGITSNLLTYLAKGDAALSISLTAATSLIGLISVPMLVNLSLNLTGMFDVAHTFPLGKMTMGILAISTIPMLLGMLVNSKRQRYADRLEPILRKVATLAFVGIVLTAFIGQGPLLMDNLPTIGPLTLALNILTMVAGFSLGWFFSLNSPEKIAIGIECGMQNAAMGIFITTNVLQNMTMLIPSLVYALTMNVTIGLFLAFVLLGPSRISNRQRPFCL